MVPPHSGQDFVGMILVERFGLATVVACVRYLDKVRTDSYR